jgi:hypothetical protein
LLSLKTFVKLNNLFGNKMYQYNSNGQKMPINSQAKLPVKTRENYNVGSSGNSGGSKSKNNTWLWIGIVTAVVVILALVFLWMRKKGGASTTSSGGMGMRRGRMGAQRWGFRFY